MKNISKALISKLSENFYIGIPEVIDYLSSNEDGTRKTSHVVYENHGQDTRYKELPKVCSTLAAAYGMGGSTKPLVVDHVKLYDVRITSENTKNSRDNVYETTTSRTISCNGTSPDGNYGGVAVVYATTKVSRHTIAEENIAHALLSSDYKEPQCVSNGEYVRRITPKECCRLQGFPDGWCDDLGIENPTDEDIAFWDDVFETHRKIVTHGVKRKTENQIRRWLKDPHTDSAEYKMWGNGVALPNVHYLLNGIAHQLRKGDSR